MIFVEGELSAMSGRAVRRLVMLMVPGGGDLDGVRAVAEGGAGGGGEGEGDSVIWDWGWILLLLLLVLWSLEGIDVVAEAGGGCWLVGEFSEEMTVMTSCSMSARVGQGILGDESLVAISCEFG